MTIQQLQATYVLEQDRILVRLNTPAGEELRLWLTRRMVRNLFPHMQQVTEEILARQATGGNDPGPDRSARTQKLRQESLRKTDFTTPFKDQASTLPIGETPLLATTIHITVCDGGTLRIGFEEELPGAHAKRSFEVTLGQDLLLGFLHLLDTTLQHADWGIWLDLGDAPEDLSGADVLAKAKPPQYLN